MPNFSRGCLAILIAISCLAGCGESPTVNSPSLVKPSPKEIASVEAEKFKITNATVTVILPKDNPKLTGDRERDQVIKQSLPPLSCRVELETDPVASDEYDFRISVEIMAPAFGKSNRTPVVHATAPAETSDHTKEGKHVVNLKLNQMRPMSVDCNPTLAIRVARYEKMKDLVTGGRPSPVVVDSRLGKVVFEQE